MAQEALWIKKILYLGEDEEGKRWYSFLVEGGGKEKGIKVIYFLMRFGIEFEKGTTDRQGNLILLFSVRGLSPWE